jgi:hypothetical protein
MEGYIKIDFTRSDGQFNYSDALWLPADHTHTEQEIETMMDERFANWKNLILNPPPMPEFVEEESGNTEDTSSSGNIES